jgi:hypothetical protein
MLSRLARVVTKGLFQLLSTATANHSSAHPLISLATALHLLCIEGKHAYAEKFRKSFTAKQRWWCD